jgi:hypothetical protein
MIERIMNTNYTFDTIEEAYDELELEDGFLLAENTDHQIWLDGPFFACHN